MWGVPGQTHFQNNGEMYCSDTFPEHGWDVLFTHFQNIICEVSQLRHISRTTVRCTVQTHFQNMDEMYCSHISRTWYVRCPCTDTFPEQRWDVLFRHISRTWVRCTVHTFPEHDMWGVPVQTNFQNTGQVYCSDTFREHGWGIPIQTPFRRMYGWCVPVQTHFQNTGVVHLLCLINPLDLVIPCQWWLEFYH